MDIDNNGLRWISLSKCLSNIRQYSDIVLAQTEYSRVITPETVWVSRSFIQVTIILCNRFRMEICERGVWIEY